MKKILLLSLLLLALFGSSHVQAADTDWVITNFESAITVQKEGAVKVQETVVVDFGNQSKHGIYRDIPFVTRNADNTERYVQYDVQSVMLDGSASEYTTTYAGSQYEIKIGDPDVTVTGRHAYQITYLATGVLQGFEGYDELNWNVTGNVWPVVIEHVAATVTLPESGVTQASCYVGAVGSTVQCFQEAHDARVQFNQDTALQPGEGITVAVGYTKGMVPLLTVPERPGSFNDLKHKLSLPTMAGTFLCILCLGLYFVIRQYRLVGRDEMGRGILANPVVAPEYEAPSKLRPGQIGLLIDERADTLDVSATIVDLAVRGYLTITELPKKWILGSSDYELVRTKKAEDGLLQYEKMLMHGLFSEKETVTVSELKNTFYKDLETVKGLLYTNLTEEGYFAENPDKVRQKYTMIGIGIVFIAGVIGFIGFTLFSSMLIGAALALALVGIVLVISARSMPKRTPQGVEAYKKAQGYKMFLSATEKYRQPFFEKENFFMDVLPYAIVFGVTEKLAKAFSSMGITPPAPTWYSGVSPFNPILFSSNMTQLSQAMNSAMASTPGSGSGGGGFSGGGFGGGGGGSW
jgi:hypothetical protein